MDIFKDKNQEIKAMYSSYFVIVFFVHEFFFAYRVD